MNHASDSRQKRNYLGTKASSQSSISQSSLASVLAVINHATLAMKHRRFGMQRSLDFESNVQETSKQALKELKDSGKLNTFEQEYMDHLWDIGEPSSDTEVNFHAGYYPDDKFGPRRRALEQKGFLSRCNKRTCKVTGKFVLTFWPTDKGLEMVGGQ
jgi:hypothetical protein